MPGGATWDGLRFGGQWRHYQELALAAFDADVAARRAKTHIVAPPGSGKTLVGLEIARRLNAPAAVLAPTSAVQRQWTEKVALFGGTDAPLHALTYQSICQTSDPEGAIAAAARTLLAAERAGDLHTTREAVLADFAAYTGAAQARLERDVAKVAATLRRDIARGGHAPLAIGDLLSERAVARIGELRDAGVRTVILDECHHLISMWGYLVRAAIEAIGDVHVIGLTATAPEAISSEEAELYADLLGDVDFEVPTPAVVKEGHLAPYHELALFTEPLPSELRWLQERHVRFQELLTVLHEPDPDRGATLAFPAWVTARVGERGHEGGARVSFQAFARQHPDLARAGLRYLAHTGSPFPSDAPRGEGFSERPTLEDWLVLLNDWALRCLHAAPGEDAQRLLDTLAVGLTDLGYTLTRRGIRPGTTDIDRVLLFSAAKPVLVRDILDAEDTAREGRLHAVVLCDSEAAPRGPEGSDFTLSGGALGTLEALGADPRTAALTPMLVTGRTVACLPAHADRILAELRRHLPEPVAAQVSADTAGVISSGHAEWQTGVYVPAVTRLLADGVSRVLIGTRGLLGEGWDCPQVNVLIDSTSVAASISVRQMRGRSLRLDPADPEKISSNWDVVCVAPQLERGQADYGRFVRRHGHLHAPCEDGSIETGVSHVHPDLSPFEPPPAAEFAALNQQQLDRAADPGAVRERWDIGGAYRGVDLPALLVRRRSEAEAPSPPPGPARPPQAAPLSPVAGVLGWAGGGGAVVAALAAVAAGPAALLVLPLCAGAAGAGRVRAGREVRARTPDLALEQAAWAVLDAYVALGEISSQAAASLRFEPRSGGYVRCVLASGSPEENRLFSTALEEAVAPPAGHRYLVGRIRLDPAAGPWRHLVRRMTGRVDSTPTWFAVPGDLGRRRDRADAYLRAWRTLVAPEAQLVYTVGDEEHQRLLLDASGRAAPYTVHRRTLWT